MTDDTSQDLFVIPEDILAEVEKTLKSGRSNAELGRELHVVFGGFGHFSVNLGMQMDLTEADLFGGRSPVIIMETTQQPVRPMMEEIVANVRLESLPIRTGRNRHEIRKARALARKGIHP